MKRIILLLGVVAALALFFSVGLAQQQDVLLQKAQILLKQYKPPEAQNKSPEMLPQEAWKRHFEALKATQSVRWVQSIVAFSSQWSGGSWSADQIIGEPNVYPYSGDNGSAWASSSSDGQREWLVLSYADPEPISYVGIYETYNPGAVDTVYVKNPNTGQFEIVWSGEAVSAGYTARIFDVFFPLTTFNVSEIRLAVNSPAVGGYNEIDAVCISQKIPPPLKVNAMPSYSVSVTYANAQAGVPLEVWGNATGGTSPYKYTLEYGDGGLDTGTVSDPRFIGFAHSYTSAGYYTMKLTVTDGAGNTDVDESLIRVYAAPSFQNRVNMAIEKGLLFLYKNQYPEGYWYDGYGSEAATGMSLLSFEENGHLPTNDFDEDIYAEFVRKGLDYLLGIATQYDIFVQASGDPDTDQDGKGAYLDSDAYANGIALLGVIGAHRTAASAQLDTITTGIYAGQTFYDFIVDALDQLYFSQTDPESGGARGGWRYSIATPNYWSSDNSAVQWCTLAMEATEKNWGMAVPQFVKDELLLWLKYSQSSNGGFGYSWADEWTNIAKTGAGIGSYAALGYSTDSTVIINAINFLDAHWNDTYDNNWYTEQFNGALYSMYAAAKGLRVINNRAGTDNVGAHNWYDEYANYLLDDPTYKQQDDGSWPASGIISWASSYPLQTSFALLILTQGVVISPPVAVIEPISSQPPETPFQVDGRNSYHQDPTKTIVEWLWDWNAADGINWNNPDATGPFPTNPGYADVDTFVITLRVKDNSASPMYDTDTRSVVILSTNNPPVAVAIPPSAGPAYAAKVGEPILLDGRASYDPDPADSVVAYNWDTNGDGVFGDATTDTVTVVFINEYQGQVGLRVYDTNGDSSSNNAYINIAASLKDIFVEEFTVDPLLFAPGDVLNLFAVFKNDDNSNTDVFDALVRFYDGDPFTIGSQVSTDFYVDLPVGARDTVETTVTMPTVYPSQGTLFAYLDANQQVAEWEEVNNLSSVGIINDISKEEKVIPREFALHQNYPNPFNPQTTIAFDLPENTEVRLGVYNIMGKEIRQLAHQRYAAGKYHVVWDGKNSKGDFMSSGVYFYTIELANSKGKFSESKKLLLLK